MAHYIYILECADKTLYTGSTTDLDKRLHAHNSLKSGAKYTRSRRPVTLRYFEKMEAAGAALSREAELKRMTRKEKLELINVKGKQA